MKTVKIPTNAVQLRSIDTHFLRELTTLSFIDHKGTVQAQFAVAPGTMMSPLHLAKDWVKISVEGDESIVLKFDKWP